MSWTRFSDWLRSHILGLVAIFLALTIAPAWGATIGSSDIEPNAVLSKHIKDGQVSSPDIGTGQVRGVDLGGGAVTGPKLATGSVSAPKLATGAVTAPKLGTGSVTTPKLATGAVNSSSVADNTLTGADVDELSLDFALLQKRISDSCAAGQAIRAVAQDGTVTCESVGAPGSFWSPSGNSGTTGADFLGTTDSQPLNLRVNNARGLRIEPASDGTNESPNVIGGIADNSVAAGAYAATIAGGGRRTPSDPGTANRVTDSLGTVGGGGNNQAGDGAGTVGDKPFAVVGGGSSNTASGFWATVSGGDTNTAGDFATVAGGEGNTASGQEASVGGGLLNQASGLAATVPGGGFNTAQGDYSLAGGVGAQANDNGSFVWADSSPDYFSSTAQNQFSVRSTGGDRFVTAIDGSGNPTSGLELPAGTSGWSTLVNGQPFDISVNGARGLRIQPASDGTAQSPNVIGGTGDNSVTSGAFAATIAGGGRRAPASPPTANSVTDDYGTVGGGGQNQAGDNAGTVSDQRFATVAGGGDNTASGNSATVSGGFGNTASGFLSTIGGGQINSASGFGAMVPGGNNNAATGNFSFAAGDGARAIHEGSFVWADSNPFQFFSSAINEFGVRATGGARFVTAIDGSGSPTAGVQLAAGGGSWSSLSDRAAKTAIDPVSGRSVLAKLDSVPVSTWRYRSQDDSIRHIGPMAQDFYRAFGVGEDRRHIDSVDADGVALAAIKGMNRKVERLQRKVVSLQKAN